MSRKKRGSLTILQACRDAQLFAPWFGGQTWQSWFAFFATVFGLELDEEAQKIYFDCTARPQLPSGFFSEVWCSCGRRAGKSLAAATIAVFLACFCDYSRFLKLGESGVVLLIAPDRRQAKVLLRYIMGFLRNIPFLKRLILNERAESVDLTNGISIEVATASHKTSRGFSAIAVILDEAAFLSTDESAEPDTELLVALRPTLATIPTSLLLVISSPYARRGELWKHYQKHFGKDSRILFWKAASRTMNPSLPQAIVDEALERDESSARAEYLAEFRSDVERLISQEVVEACTMAGRIELPPSSEIRYVAFVDPSGGSADSFTLAIAHQAKNEKAILDCVRERKPPFSPDATVLEFAETLKQYGISRVTGDAYAGEWPRERFRAAGIEYVVSDKARSEIYLAFLPLLNAGRAELLENKRLANELIGLERRTARSGRDSIDHAPGSHDDAANAAAGALVLAASGTGGCGIALISVGGKSYDFANDPDAGRKLRQERGWRRIRG